MARTELVRYIGRGHRTIDGWIEPGILRIIADLSDAQRRAGVRGGVVEIGVHHGRLFVGMHLTREEGEISVGIDLYEDQTLNVDGSGQGDEAQFRANLARHANGDQDVKVVKADSTTLNGQAVQQLVGGDVRLFDVDGGHYASIVRHDLATAAGCLTRGGIVLSDDTFNQQWPGVYEGTLRFLDENPNLVPFGIGFNKVMFTTPGHAAAYRDVLWTTAQKKFWRWKSAEMHDHPVTIVWQTQPRDRARLVAKRMLRKQDHMPDLRSQ